MNIILGSCADALPQTLGLFDFSIAPPLLFYSYIPILVFSIILASVIYVQDRKSRESLILVGLVAMFALWVINVIIQWTAVHHFLINFAWQLTALFEVGIFVLAILFFYAVSNRDRQLSRSTRFGSGVVMAIVVLITPTVLNIASYDVVNCEGTLGVAWIAIYALEILAVFWVLGAAIWRAYKQTDIARKREILLLGVGLAVFLALFSGSNIYGELTQNYEFNLIGPIGMVVLLGMILYLVTRYRVFQVRMFMAQVLVLGLWFLIFSLIFVNNLALIHIVVLITLVLSVFLGFTLMRSVRKGAEQRENLLFITKELESANAKLTELDKIKNEFLSFATHQMRSPLTSIKWGLETLLDEETSGKLSEPQKTLVHKVKEISVNMATTVNDLLDISKLDQGGLVLQKEVFSLADLVHSLYDEMKPVAEGKKLAISYVPDKPSKYIVAGDQTKLRQVITNLIDNAIKYTDAGSIEVHIGEGEAGKVRVSVTDSGRGLAADEIEKLFAKFMRAKSGEANKGGSGLGLYLAKKIIEMHGGALSVTSPGQGKGATFSFSLPFEG